MPAGGAVADATGGGDRRGDRHGRWPGRGPRDAAGSQPGQYHGASVYAHDGDLTWWPIEMTGPAVGHSVLDLLPGGEILVVGSRSQRFRTAGICRAISLESRICCADSAMSLTTGAYRQLGVALAGAPASWSRTCT